MIAKFLGVTAICGVALAVAPAFAGNAVANAAGNYPALGPNDEVVPVVAPGEEIGIACAALGDTAPSSDVRVVLTISSAPSDAPAPGYKKVLATNEQLLKGAVRVKIPTIADLDDRTVNVDVYVVNAEGAHNCDAGTMRIADGLKHAKGKDS
jgi:hypothetical protein